MPVDIAPPGSHPGIEPRPSLRRRLDLSFRKAAPWLFVLVATFLLSAPSGLPGESELLFGVCLGSVYFWSAHEPGAMPSWAVFLCGLFADLVGFGPPGTILLSLLVGHGIAHTWRYGLSRINFLLGWALLGALALILSLFQWFIACLHGMRLVAIEPALFQAALTIGIYPSLSAMFVWVHRVVVNVERA